jgi:exosome complex component RRP4
MLKKETACEIFVGQNGRIWINGKDEDMDKLSEAIDIIIRESHTSGLTDKISQFLQVEKGTEKEIEEDKVEEDTDLETAESEDTEDAEDVDETSRKVNQLLDTEEN